MLKNHSINDVTEKKEVEQFHFKQRILASYRLKIGMKKKKKITLSMD